MDNQVTTEQLNSKFNEFVDLFLNFRTQNCEAENLKGLADLITTMEGITAHVRIAYSHTACLKELAWRMGKFLMVTSRFKEITNGWESHINYTWRADSKVGQERARKDVVKSNCTVFLYTPETDTVVDVTEQFKTSESFIDFSNFPSS
jgi:hypothetical protein